MAYEGPLPREEPQMTPHNRVQDPACGGVLHQLSRVMGQGRLSGLACLTDAGLEGRIDESPDRHHHHQGHDPCGLFEIA
jgi:hypothetical protein